MQSDLLNRYLPKQGLTYDFAVPIPVAQVNHRPKVGNVYPGSFLRYSNKTKLDPTWVDRCEVRSNLEQALRILNAELVETTEKKFCHYLEPRTNTEKYAGLYKWANPMDAYYTQNITCNDVFYVVRDTALRLYHERTIAAGIHPQIGTFSTLATQAKVYEATNQFAKEAAKTRKDRRGSWRKVIGK